MTTKQLIAFAQSMDSIGIIELDPEAKKKDLIYSINYFLQSEYNLSWTSLKKSTEILWESGNLNYDPSFTVEEPSFDGFSLPSSPITGSKNIQENDFYKVLKDLYI